MNEGQSCYLDSRLITDNCDSIYIGLCYIETDDFMIFSCIISAFETLLTLLSTYLIFYFVIRSDYLSFYFFDGVLSNVAF